LYRLRLIRRRVDRRYVIGAAVVLVLLVIGVAGYALAASKGVDASAAQFTASRAGERRGEVAGTHQGYADGFKSGREHAFQSAYREAFASAYRSEFERAGLPAPDEVPVKGP
jgi:hypothetical protein